MLKHLSHLELSRASSSVKPPEQGGWDVDDSLPSQSCLIILLHSHECPLDVDAIPISCNLYSYFVIFYDIMYVSW